MRADLASDRQILRISGADRQGFIHGLVTNDVAPDRLTYAALLTPQGKYLADFFLYQTEDAIFVDAKADQAPSLIQRLSMYKLRADVTIEALETPVYRGTGTAPQGAYPDPRDPSLGWRYYGTLQAEPAGIDWEALRVAASV
ncbi:MAG: folate-binding protein, partial [Pseudomonadota bacterium]